MMVEGVVWSSGRVFRAARRRLRVSKVIEVNYQVRYGRDEVKILDQRRAQ